MNYLQTLKKALCGSMLLAGGMVLWAQDIVLPAPDTTGGKPLMEVLKTRKSLRAYSPRELTRQQLSDLLWAAWGVNRADGKRTAPTACNHQEIDVAVCLSSGTYLYEAKENRLKQLGKKDIRKSCGIQPFVAKAPVILVLLSDYRRMKMLDEDHKPFYSGIDIGYVSQNIYLYCTSAGLSTVALGMINRELIAKELKLATEQKVMLGHPVGFPEK